MEMLCHRDFHCHAFREKSLELQLAHSRLLVIPPPHWPLRPSSRTLANRSLRALHESGSKVHPELSPERWTVNGVRLPIRRFVYEDQSAGSLWSAWLPTERRRGDRRKRLASDSSPADAFDTPPQSLPLSWSRVGVICVRWRPSATFNILPGATVCPLALSTGGRCLSFDCTPTANLLPASAHRGGGPAWFWTIRIVWRPPCV